MSDCTFAVGRAYQAVPALVGARRKLVVCVAREGRSVHLVWVEDLSIEESKAFDFGREMIRASRPDGVFTISAACPVDTIAASHVMACLDMNRRAVPA